MEISLTNAKEDVYNLIAKVMHENHCDMERQHVTIRVQMAMKQDKNGEVIPVWRPEGGREVLSKTLITPLRDRISKIPDATITIDEEWGWNRLAESRRYALIDHALLRLDLKRDGEGVPLFDDANRPRLCYRPYDIVIKGYAEALARHGEASEEARQVRFFEERTGQLDMFGSAKTKAKKATVKDGKVEVVEEL